MPRYQVIEPILHDGTRYNPGQTIELSIAAANELRAHQALGPLLQGPAPVEAGQAPAPEAVAQTPLPDDFPARELLIPAELATVEAAQAASDARLLSVKGIGPGIVTKIRDWKPAAVAQD